MSINIEEDVNDFLDDATAGSGEIAEFCDEHGLDVEFVQAAHVRGAMLYAQMLSEALGPHVTADLRTVLEKTATQLEESYESIKGDLEA